MANKNVNHPQHYNQHPAGIECISIIRHYTCDVANALKYLWRAGLKPEMGKDDVDKEIEDLRKALWYIEDYQNTRQHHIAEAKPELIESYIQSVTGHTPFEITKGYDDSISLAIFQLLQMGLVVNGAVYAVYGWPKMLGECKALIHHRIETIYAKAADQNIKEIHQMVSGQRVEGIHYAKPGCERDTEPEKYDPLNIIIRDGDAYCLSDEKREKPNGAMYSPCELCALRHECDEAGTNSPCQLLSAFNHEYLREVGRAKYDRHFGTITVIDELKESLKHQDDEEE